MSKSETSSKALSPLDCARREWVPEGESAGIRFQRPAVAYMHM